MYVLHTKHEINKAVTQPNTQGENDRKKTDTRGGGGWKRSLTKVGRDNKKRKTKKKQCIENTQHERFHTKQEHK